MYQNSILQHNVLTLAATTTHMMYNHDKLSSLNGQCNATAMFSLKVTTDLLERNNDIKILIQ